MHRIGQLKVTHFVKIVVRDSIDERLIAMQSHKQQRIAEALREDAGHKTALSLDDYKRLIGADVEVNDEGEDEEGGEEADGEEGEDEGGEARPEAAVESAEEDDDGGGDDTGLWRDWSSVN